jgi:hypothetical protein
MRIKVRGKAREGLTAINDAVSRRLNLAGSRCASQIPIETGEAVTVGGVSLEEEEGYRV